MTTRLNANLRAKIVEAALAKAGITAEQAALVPLRAAWNEDVRLFTVGLSNEEVQRHIDKVKKAHAAVPENIRRDLNSVVARRTYDTVNLAGITVQVDFNDEYRFVRKDRGIVPAGHPLVDRFYALEDAKKQLMDRASTLRATVNAVLNRVTTVKKLLEVWPEAKELLPANLEEAKVNLPALAISDLNAAIGLPSPQEKAA